MLPDIQISYKQGGTGRASQNFDEYSGLILYGTAPTVTGKWSTYPGPPQIKAQQIFSAADAVNCGVIANSENTASQGTILITVAGTTGDTAEIIATVPKQNGTTEDISLGEYTVTSAHTTIALQGAAWIAVINAGTSTHGWTATFSTATITLTAPKDKGISLNTGTVYAITYSSSATFAATITQNTVAGTVSQYAIWYYQISEFFRKFPTGNLWVGILAASDDFKEVSILQKASGSKLRQCGVYDTDETRGAAANIVGTLTLLDTACKLTQQDAPLSAIYSPNIHGITDLSTYPDQNINTANKTQCIISQDGLAAGALLYVVSEQSIGNIGIKLATLASSRVSASDAQAIELFNCSNGVENDTPAFANGDLMSDIAESLWAQLDSYRYTFFRKWGDTVTGTYWTDNKCCVSGSSDYAFMNDNRTIDKISRILRAAYIPILSGEIIFNSDGTMQDFVVESLTDTGDDAVTSNMITGYGTSPLISGFSTFIDPAQPLKQTNELVVDCEIVQNGIARKIQLNLGFSLSI